MSENKIDIYDKNNNIIKSIILGKTNTRIHEGILLVLDNTGVTYGFKHWGRYELYGLDD